MGIDTVNDLPRRVQYTAIASQEDFDYPFPIFVDADLVVDVDGVPQSLNTDYTVAGEEDDLGGTITFLTPMAGNEVVTIYSELAIERTADYQQNGPWSSARTNDEFDRIVLICRELKDRIGRAIRWPFPASQGSADLELSPISNWFGKFLRVSDAGILEPAEVAESTVPLTSSIIGGLVNPQTEAEVLAAVTPVDYTFVEGNRDRYANLSQAVAVCKNANTVLLLGTDTDSIASSLTIDKVIAIDGVGCDVSVTVGSIIASQTNDVAAIVIDDAGTNDAQRSRIDNCGFINEAPSHYAIEAYKCPDSRFESLVIACNGLGKGGILYGDEIAASVGRAYQCITNHVRVDDYVGYGFRVNTTGHTLEFRNCSPRSAEPGSHGFYINTRNVHIYGGQANGGVGGYSVYWYNIDSQGHSRGSVNDMVFEGTDVGEYSVVIDGATDTFSKIEINRCGTSLNGNQGTMVKFGRATDCVLNMPSVLSPTSGGILAEWTANSTDCRIRVDLDGAKAPLTVSGSAVRPLKEVVGRIALSSVANITTYTNLTTILLDGIVELPNILPVHNGVSWNYVPVTPAQIAANTDNYSPTGLGHNIAFRLSTDASRNLTGIVAQAGGTRMTIHNVGGFDLVLVHDATSTNANRFLCPGSANYTLNTNDSATIVYDATSSRWRVIEA